MISAGTDPAQRSSCFPLDMHSLMERWCGSNLGVGAGIDGVTRAGPDAAKEGRRQSERFGEPDRFGRQQAEVSISLAHCSLEQLGDG